MRREPWRACIEDLEPADVIHVVCHVCGHQARLTAAQIVARIKPGATPHDLHPITPVKAIGPHLRCSRCQGLGHPRIPRGRVDVHIEQVPWSQKLSPPKRCPRVIQCPAGTCKERVTPCID